LKAITEIRERIFREHLGQTVTAIITAEAPGVLSGIQQARNLMESLGLCFSTGLPDRSVLKRGQEIARVTGNPLQIAQAEERVIGSLSKPSGIATAARKALQKVGARYQVVSGGWKKMPFEIKDIVRQAVRDGGLSVRISEEPFVYLDKNYVRILGGVGQAVQAALPLNRTIVVQIRGENSSVEDEAIEAALAGANVVMVDTGRCEHLKKVIQVLKNRELRSKVRIAFAGNVTLDDLDVLAQMDLDVVDIGYAILDAPCLPMRFDVVRVVQGGCHWNTVSLKKRKFGSAQ
jgi:nicotinate-nucleotide pyrophosphorylase (carboxylating)